MAPRASIGAAGDGDGAVSSKSSAEPAARFGAELAAARNSADAAEGIRAFKERRNPRYAGR